MLWLIRRPRARKLQRWTIDRVPLARRDAARAAMIKQEKFARRIGLPVLTFTVRAFFASVFLTYFFLFVLTGTAEGWLVIPTREALNLDSPPEPSGLPVGRER